MMQRKGVRTWIAAAGVAGLVGVAVGGTAHADGIGRFAEHDLVSDVAGRADVQDPDLVNAWGMAQGPTSPVWDRQPHQRGDALHGRRRDRPADQRSRSWSACPATGSRAGSSTRRRGSSSMTAPPQRRRSSCSTPSGDVTGWSPGAASAALHAGWPAAHVDGAVFKGPGRGDPQSGKDRLYAADFHHGTIRSSTTPSSTSTWTAPSSTGSADGFAPFNVAAIGGNPSAWLPSGTRPGREVAGRARGSSTSTTRHPPPAPPPDQPRSAERAVGHDDRP